MKLNTRKLICFLIISLLFLTTLFIIKHEDTLIIKELASEAQQKSFIVYVRYNNLNILFDVGKTKEILYESLKKNNLELKQIDYIIISHKHGDHSRALSFLGQEELSPKTKILINEKVYAQITEKFNEKNFKELNIIQTKGDFQINPHIYYTDGLYTTKQYKEKSINEKIYESFLVLEKDNKLIVISGCGHVRINEMCEYAKKLTKQNRILAVIGGMAILTVDKANYLNNSNIEVYPIHCSKNWDKTKIKNYRSLPLISR